MNSNRRTLAELLQTWQQWSYRNLLTSTIARVAAGGDADRADRLREGLAKAPAVAPLEALAANAELTGLLRGRQWHAIRDARERGATWAAVADALQTTPERARAQFLEHIERAERYAKDWTETAPYRAVLDEPESAANPPIAPTPARASTVGPAVRRRGVGPR